MPAWKPSCLRPSDDCYPTAKDVDLEERSFGVDQSAVYGITTVELYRRDVSAGLGVVITGGADHNEYPRISQIRPGSVADRSDVLQCGDYLISINDVPTAKLSHEEIVNLLRQAGQHLRLEIKYPLPPVPSSKNCQHKEASLVIPKENDSFGMTIRRGQQQPSADRPSPFIVTRLRPGSPADRDGLIRVGDRIIAIDATPVDGMSDSQMTDLLRKPTSSARFTLEYDVQIIDAVVNANGPLFVEIDRAGARSGSGRPLGMQITTGSRGGPERSLVIESIISGSIAERCGALSVGDRILSIEGTPCDNMTVPEAIQLLENASSPTVNMLILPASVIQKSEAIVNGTSSMSRSERASSQVSNGTLTRNSERSRPPLATLLRNKSSSARSQSPPPLPRLPEQLYQKETSETPIRPMYQPAARTNAAESRAETTMYQPAARLVETTFHPVRKLSDAESSSGSLYDRPVRNNADHEGTSFLVTLERRKNEPWGIGLGYRRNEAATDIVVQHLDSAGVAYRTEAVKVGDVISSINGRPMRNQNLGDAYYHLNSYDIATLKIVRKVEHRIDPRHSPAESANSNASVDSAVESWDSVRTPQQHHTNHHRPGLGSFNAQRPLPHSVSAHHVAEVDSVTMRIRGSESIPERLDRDMRPTYRDAENLKNSVEIMDQIISLNDMIAQKRPPAVPPKPAPKPILTNGQSSHAGMLDHLLEDLALMRTNTPPTGTRRVKFQTPNGHVTTPDASNTNSLGKSKLFEITLRKDPFYEDFGFSLSDGAFERGVFVNRIRPGGPAEAAGLQTCDQLLKVNNKDVRELDCCQAVPFIASSGDSINLLVSRRSLNKRFFKTEDSAMQNSSREVEVLESDML